MRIQIGKSLKSYILGPFHSTSPLLLEKFTHRGALFGITIVLLVAVGFKHRPSMVLGISLAIYLAFLFLRLRHQAQGIEISRYQTPTHGIEERELTIKLKIKNASTIPLHHFYIEDAFEASLDPVVKLSAEDKYVPAKRARVIKYKKVCDGGMGEHTLGPIFIHIKDPLGVFEFRIYDMTQKKLTVFPKIQSLPSPDAIGNALTPPIGDLNVFDKEQSVDFLGIRQFFPGDPIKQIAWRISAKTDDLLVKEFEKVVSTISYVVIDMNPRHHMGIKSLSTWEIMRDAALSLIRKFASDGHQVGLISQDTFMEPQKKSGSVVESFGLKLIHLNPHMEIQAHLDKFEFMDEDLLNQKNSGALYKICREYIKSRSQMVFICTYMQDELQSQIEFFRYMRAKGVRVTVYYIDVVPLFEQLHSKLGGNYAVATKKHIINRKKLALDMTKNNISTYVIDLNLPFWESFAQRDKLANL